MDTNLSQYTNLASAFLEEQGKYAIKPTKASSARLRAISNQLSKLGAPLRKELVASDKAK